MSKHPEVIWAQRSSSTAAEKNIVYLTVNLPDIVESSLEYELTPTSLSFKTRAGRSEYAFGLEFFKQVDPEKSTRHLTSRSLVAILRKNESNIEYWPRLTKDKLKTPFIKTDFSKWVDEDEQDGITEVPDDDFGGMGGIPGMGGGIPGMGGGIPGMGGGIPGMGGGIPGMGGGIPGMEDGMDFSKLMKEQGGLNFGGSAGSEANDADESDDDGPPPLEVVPEVSK